MLNSELESLKNYPYLKKGVLCFDEYTIEYTHPFAMYYEYHDIFMNKIYHFDAENDTPFIIDAGACIGMSIYYFKRIYPKSKIIAFEPDPAIFSVLQRNIENNHLQEIELINAGIGENQAEVSFYSDGSDGGSVGQINNSTNRINVNIVRLSEYLTQKVDLLKMNIEGMEGKVFKEIDNKLEFVKEIIIEYHCYDNIPQSLGDILNIFDKNGFRYVVTEVPSAKIPIPFHLEKNYRYYNLIYGKKI